MVRLGFDSTALQQLNPALTEWNTDALLDRGIPARSKPAQQLEPTATTAIRVATDWGVQQLLHPSSPTTTLHVCIGRQENPTVLRQQITTLLKQRMVSMSVADYHRVPHRNAADPTPLRSLIAPGAIPNKPHHLHQETNPMAATRARLRHNRAYTQINIDTYNKVLGPAAGLCEHDACLANRQPETVSHILLDCPRYLYDRGRLQYQLNTLTPKQPLNLRTALGTLATPLLSSTKATDRNNYYARFLSLSAAFIDAIQHARAQLNLRAF